MTTFFIGGYAQRNPAYQGAENVHFVFCHKCGAGDCGTFPPWHPHKPSLWECLSCGAKFGVHKVPENQNDSSVENLDPLVSVPIPVSNRTVANQNVYWRNRFVTTTTIPSKS